MNHQNNLDKRRLLGAVNELYRLTLLFPKREPLRYKMRSISDELLANIISLSNEDQMQAKFAVIDDSVKNLEVLDSFFEIARGQKWVKPSELLSLQEEYSRIKEEVIRMKEQNHALEAERTRSLLEERPVVKPMPMEVKKEEPVLAPEPEERPERVQEAPAMEFSVSERQRKILDYLGRKGKAQVWEVKEIFPDVSKRTLRRDFKDLLKYGLVERRGERNNTFYRLKVGQEI
jgi:DNA-binding transcriptional ArsR family regulator